MGKLNTCQHTHPQTTEPGTEFWAQCHSVMGPETATEVTE